jgi:outer membrane protein assembly factor BamB
MNKTLVYLATCMLFLSACKEKEEDKPTPNNIDTVPAFYAPATSDQYGMKTPELTLIADQSNQVIMPWDLDFHPTRANELWVINKGTERTGGNTVTITNAGQANQSTERRQDGNAWHFMALPSSMSFSQENDNWATGAEIQDANRQGGTFTGPSLWSSDMNIYAKPSGGNGSHLDMLHSSPYSMGIESDKDNAFWVFDGYNGHICWYNFQADHGPGNSDHDDGIVHRYREVSVKRLDGVASHLVLDKATGWLYIVDSGNARILKMNTKTGSKLKDLALFNEVLAEHWEMSGVDWKVFTNKNLMKPAGIELSNNVLYVSDFETGEIVAYDVASGAELARFDTGKKGIMGIKADASGKLWFVSSKSNQVYRIDPK